MKLLLSATYFEPHRSGLSTYAFRLAKGLSDLGHEVVVLTSAFDDTLPLEEEVYGFRVVRVPVSFKISKGVVMLGLPKVARKLLSWADAVNLHLPQFESFYLSALAKRLKKPVVTTWHCDLEMHGGWFGKVAGSVTNYSGRLSLRNSDVIIQNSMDYARSSRYLSKLLHKVIEVETPIELRSADPEIVDALRSRLNLLPGTKIIGLAGRVAREKGYEYLAQSMPYVWKVLPNTRVVHAGMWQGVVGEQDYQKFIEGLIEPFGSKWTSLGFLSNDEFRAFFSLIDVLAFSSLNRTESFGIVQVEALAQGTPIVASDLPGVRQPVSRTGMGEIVPLRDAQSLARGLIKVIKEDKPKQIHGEYLKSFAIPEVALKYQSIFEKIHEHGTLN